MLVDDLKLTPKKKNPPNLLKILNSITRSKNLQLSIFLSNIDLTRSGFLEIEDLKLKLNSYGKNIQYKDLEEFTEKIQGKKVIVLQKILQLYSKYEYSEENSNDSSSEKKEEAKLLERSPNNKVPVFNFDSSPLETNYTPIKESEVSHFFKHLSLCMQLHRLEKEEIQNTIFGKKINNDKVLTQQKLIEYFKSPPFMFIENVKIDIFCEFLLQPSSVEKSKKKEHSATVKEITERLEKYLPS